VLYRTFIYIVCDVSKRGWNFSCSRGIHLNSDRLACIWNQVWSVVRTHESKSSMWHIKSSSSNKKSDKICDYILQLFFSWT
jgi:hypothetical protein